MNLTFLFSEKQNYEEMFFGETVFTSPCLQVFSYNYGQTYYEISQPLLPFCDSVWCGFNNLTMKYQFPSTWLCLPN